MPGYPDEMVVPVSVAEAEATITAIDHAHRTGGFTSKEQAKAARTHRHRLRTEIALALLAAAGAEV